IALPSPPRLPDRTERVDLGLGDRLHGVDDRSHQLRGGVLARMTPELALEPSAVREANVGVDVDLAHASTGDCAVDSVSRPAPAVETEVDVERSAQTRQEAEVE